MAAAAVEVAAAVVLATTAPAMRQGYSKPTGGVDAAIRYEFLKNKAASLTLSANDIFRTRINNVFTTSEGFVQEASRRRDPQFFRLQFNWRFGKVRHGSLQT